MNLTFLILAALIVVSSIAAMSLRNLVHCALCLVVTFVGLAGIFLQLNAEFLGFVQVLVYVGAVAILLVFTILLTRNSETVAKSPVTGTWFLGLLVGVLVFGTLANAIVHSPALQRPATPAPTLTVKNIGDQLMTQYVLPLEIIALLLTAALLGAVIIALKDPVKK